MMAGGKVSNGARTGSTDTYLKSRERVGRRNQRSLVIYPDDIELTIEQVATYFGGQELAEAWGRRFVTTCEAR